MCMTASVTLTGLFFPFLKKKIFTLAGHYVNTVHKYRKVRCITSNKTGDLILIVEASSSVVSIVQ